jgi:hypothetical protein
MTDDDLDIGAMAKAYATWVHQQVGTMRDGVTVAQGVPYLDPGVTAALRETVWELSPDAARFALVAALVALIPTDA